MTVSSKTAESLGKKKQAELAPVINRFEMKYTIPFSMIEPVSQFIAPYCSMDRYSENSVDGFYTINSLYFDTPMFLFLRLRMQRVEKRFNMRIRSYGESSDSPSFLEIKQRFGDIVRKHRGKVNSNDLETLCKDGYCGSDEENDKNTGNCALFCRTAHRYNASPVVLVQYRRKAYISDVDDYARVTFDIGLRAMEPKGYQPTPVESEMIPCDIQTSFDEGCSVILELKCSSTFVPLWMIDLVRAFNLKRRGFSKYSTCLKPIVNRFGLGGIFCRQSIPAIDEILGD